MKLPLLLEAKPRILVGSPVMILAGKWRIEAKKVIDTYLDLVFDSPHPQRIPVINDKEIEFSEDTKCFVELIKPGSESSISIYLIKCH